jgi:osmotically-inducible protein OsmY
MRKLLPLVSLGALTAWFLKSRQSLPSPSGLIARLPGTSGSSAATTPADDPATFAGNPDDARLTDKVETEIFRDADVPKGDVNVNVEFGKVVLRGQVESQELIDDLVARTRGIEGVNDVENLLHLPGEPAPMHE